MAEGIYIATAGAVARQHRLEIVANNLANVDTTGFRAQEVGFQEVLRDEVEAPNRRLVSVGRTFTSPRPGSLRQTNNPMDLAIEGRGFFVVGPQNLLTRTLTLQVGEGGVLQDSFGRTVAGTGGPIYVDGLEPVTVGGRGEVVQRGEIIDRLRTVAVGTERGLQPMGVGLLQATPDSGSPIAVEAQVVAGALEGSNVNALQSMVDLIRLNRDYQSLSRAISSYREADQALINSSRS
jgi:flagellar basal-body rod protein FlgG